MMTYRDPDAAAKIARQEREKKESIGDLIDRLKRLTLADERRENERLWDLLRRATEFLNIADSWDTFYCSNPDAVENSMGEEDEEPCGKCDSCQARDLISLLNRNLQGRPAERDREDDSVTHYVAPLVSGVQGAVRVYDTDPLEELTEEERKRMETANRVGGVVANDMAFTMRSLLAERRENARLREELTDAKSSIVAFLADFDKWQDCIVDEDGEIHDLGVLRGALAGEVKNKKCTNCGGIGYVDEDIDRGLGMQRIA